MKSTLSQGSSGTTSPSLEEYQQRCDDAAALTRNHVFLSRPYYVHFHPHPNRRILDIGSYVGANLCRFAVIAREVVGIEAAQDYVDACYAHLAMLPGDLQKRVRVICGLVEGQEFAGDFDYVICTEMLLHVVDPVTVLCKVHEALKPETGEAFLTIVDRRLATHVRDPSMSAFLAWCHEAGLQVDRSLTDLNQHIIIARRAA